MNKKKKIILLIVFICLTIISIVSFIFAVNYNHILWLNEYTAQMEKFGYYNSHIKLIDQEQTIMLVMTWLIGSTIGTFGFGILSVWTIADSVAPDYY